MLDVRPSRIGNKRHAPYADQLVASRCEPRPEYASKLYEGLNRCIVTPTTSKHRLFAWLSAGSIAGSRTDCHRFGTMTTPSACCTPGSTSYGHGGWEPSSGRWSPAFATPRPPASRPSRSRNPTRPQRTVIAAAAARLNQLREGWLNPPQRDGFGN